MSLIYLVRYAGPAAAWGPIPILTSPNSVIYKVKQHISLTAKCRIVISQAVPMLCVSKKIPKSLVM
jgi:hypothetical protein